MGRETEISDEKLLSALKDGERNAFRQIYDRYWQLLYVAARKVISDQDEAKDVVQEVFFSLLTRGTDIEVHGSLSNYLYSAVRYKIFDHISKQKVRTEYADSLRQFSTLYTENTDRALLEGEITAQIEKEIQNLPKKMRVIFELSRKQELTHHEIASVLNISDKTVKKQISNALKLLKPKFTNYYCFFILPMTALLKLICRFI